RSARSQILALARNHLDVEPESELQLRGGRVTAPRSPGFSVEVADLLERAYAAGGDLVSASAMYNPSTTTAPDKATGYGNPSPAYSFGVQAAEVEVDLDTGQVTVLKVVAVHDVGLAINPLLVEGQVEGGVAMGQGYCLFEDLRLREGFTHNSSFAGYKIINSSEAPVVNCQLVETDDPEGPFGAKGVGEMALIPTAPAIANAIFNATGARIKELPITAERLLAELQKQEVSHS
ncbi:MAG: molybdopterin-dependent oxidoreductase, partial [Proteobacteria bacterium]|nr:molybdopterin-dependent oxidoreductase [Pseudomonadota bacterium]